MEANGLHPRPPARPAQNLVNPFLGRISWKWDWGRRSSEGLNSLQISPIRAPSLILPSSFASGEKVEGILTESHLATPNR